MDDISKALGELTGKIDSNHSAVMARMDKVEVKVDALQSLHWKLKGSIATISVLAAAIFHVILEAAKQTFK